MRKRVTEQDLLNFYGERAPESAAEQPSAAPSASALPVKAERGYLLIADPTAIEGGGEALEKLLRAEGLVVRMCDVESYAGADQIDNTPKWLRWLTQAQNGYTELCDLCERVTVVCLGYGLIPALLIAEQYPVDGLIAVSGVMRLPGGLFFPGATLPGARVGVSAKPARKLAKLAARNLFSIVCPVLLIASEGDPSASDAEKRIAAGSRAEKVEAIRIRREEWANAGQSEESALADALRKHFLNRSDTKPLAK